MPRKTKEELNLIKQKYNVDVLWSFSRVNCWLNDRYEYLLRYIKKVKEDNATSIYGEAGGSAHQCLEDFYDKKIKYEDMISQWEDKKDEFELLELKFNKGDEDKNKKIANNYFDCVAHFFKNHQEITKQNLIEYFLTITINDNIFQGYIDMLCVEKKDDIVFIDVIDFKTSTLYTGKKIEQEERQLLLYGLGIHQKLSVPLEQITCKWDFLKYTKCYVQKKGKKPKKGEILPIEYKERFLKRNEIGISLASEIKMWGKTLEYSEEEITDFVQSSIILNSIDNLPVDLQGKFRFEDAYVNIEITQEKIDNLIQEFSNTIEDIVEYTNEWNIDKDDSIFEYEVCESDIFRLLTLCSYSRKIHIPLDKYFIKKEQEETDKNRVITGNSDNDIVSDNTLSNNEELDDWLKSL